MQGYTRNTLFFFSQTQYHQKHQATPFLHRPTHTRLTPILLKKYMHAPVAGLQTRRMNYERADRPTAQIEIQREHPPSGKGVPGNKGLGPSAILTPRKSTFTRYCYHEYCMVYCIKRKSRWEERILRNGRAIVLPKGRLCRWGEQ